MYLFHPPVRLGLVFQSAISIALIIGAAWGFWQASQAEVGPVFLLFLLPVFVALFIVPFLVYRAYALGRASYVLERDGLRLRWGLREVDIPMDVVRNVRLVSEAEIPIPAPRLRWPGSVLGRQRLPGGDSVEFLAAQTKPAIVINTFGGAYVISPTNPGEFLRIFRGLAELGSLSPLSARSVYPSFLLARVWASRPARYLLIGNLGLSLILLIVVSLIVPSRVAISLGFMPDGSPTDLVPSVRLLLLPLINGFFFLTDTLVGLFFYRRAGEQLLAYLLWGSGALTTLLFLGAVVYIVSAG